MSYDDDQEIEEKSFNATEVDDDADGFIDDIDEPLEPIEGITDFGDDSEEDPDKDH